MDKKLRAAHVLCWADDLATGSVVDPHVGFPTHKTHCQVISDPSPGELKFLQFHRSTYQRAFDPTSKFDIVKCNRYHGDGEVGAKIVAKSFIPKEQVLKDLCGTMKSVTDDFLVPGINDFSVIYSSRQNIQRLWLGPAAYLNHDCNSNAVIYSLQKDLVCAKTVRDISPGEEITVHYGDTYFGKNDCRCHTCEANMDKMKYECAYCCSKFKYKSWLKKHILSHNHIKTYLCSLCKKQFSTRNTLNTHVKEVHFGIQNQRCKKCQKKFGRKATLKKHLNTVHKNIYYKCKICPKKYKNKHDLIYHLNTHDGVKPYECPICKKGFNSPKNMYKHKKLHK